MKKNCRETQTKDRNFKIKGFLSIINKKNFNNFFLVKKNNSFMIES